MLGSVAAVSTPGLIAGVVALLQDELLPLELWVLVTDPAGGEGRVERDDQEEETGKEAICPPGVGLFTATTRPQSRLG